LYAGLVRVAERAKGAVRERFTALAHHLASVEFLKETFGLMNRRGAAGIDGQTVEAFGRELDAHVADLAERMKRRAYDAPPVRRVYIPKAGQPGKMRPLGIPVVADRLLQAAVARILSAIYEPVFLGVSYGFRPGRGAHDALRRIRTAVMGGRVRYVYEADIRSFFDTVDHAWLMRMLELKIGDPWILRLVRKWLGAGVWEGGVVTRPGKGTPQGGPLSPVLANVYLHYVLDLWFTKVVRPRLRGYAELLRYADDFVVLFEDAADAERFAAALPKRMARFGLELAPEKTRLIPFGAAWGRQGPAVTGSFEFLGFRHLMGRRRRGWMTVVRIPSRSRVQRFLAGVKEWLWQNLHRSPQEQQEALAAKLRGLYQYYGITGCTRHLNWARYQVVWYWVRALRRRGQRHHLTWETLQRKPWFRLPTPKVVHPGV
jgi:RNA-directed DNA polymerase